MSVAEAAGLSSLIWRYIVKGLAVAAGILDDRLGQAPRLGKIAF